MQENQPEQAAGLGAIHRFAEARSHPLVIGVAAVLVAGLTFVMGVRIGEAAYGAFDGEGMMAAIFGATLVVVLGTIIATGVVLDRRQATRDAGAAPLDAAQREQLRTFVQPGSPVVRWYQPIAVAVFIALAVPGGLLLNAPWDGAWVLAVLIANPLARWLRAQGHVLTARDLGFPVPGLSSRPSIAYAALAATAGMAVAVLLWAEALESTLAANLTGAVVIAIVVGGALATQRHQRRHIGQLLATCQD